MSPVAITLLLAIALAGFVTLAWRKLSIITALGREVRWDRPAARLKTVLVNGLLQSRMVRREWKPGVMHAVIFLGFMTLLVRKVQLLVIGYRESFAYPGSAGALFTSFKDLVELAVLAAVAYAFWRRLVQKPARLERNREAWMILSLIAAIMITDFLFDGFRFALLASADPGIAHERSFAFVGRTIADVLAQLPREQLLDGYRWSYWIQMSTVFAFLVILPVGEHFHIVTALPALFFRRGEPANRVPTVDLEKLMAEGDAGDLRIGVGTARELSWKDAFDAFTCTECGRCKDACPTFVTGKPLSLKWVNDSLKQHLLDQRKSIVGEVDAQLPPLVGAVIAPETLWACTTCGYCEEACPIELEHLPRFYRMRQHQVLMEGAFPHELKAVFDAYEVQSNPWGLPAETRGDWTKGLDVRVVHTAQDVEQLDYLFYVGSAASFDPQGQRIAIALVKILKHAGVRFGILGRGETSTGECVRRAGNEMLFQQLARTLVGTLNALRVKRIVTCDPHAFNSLKNEYPEFGGHYEVLHHTQLIAKLIAEGRLRLVPGHERVIYHEPCYLARHNGEYEAPRTILASLTEEPLEFELRREKAMCCGAGGARMWMEERIGRRINIVRVEQALPHRPRVIATACPYCATMMSDGVKALGRDSEIETRDIAELVAGSLEVDAGRPAKPDSAAS